MKRIYTRTGDRGTTGIHGGERVEKDDIRIEANGTIDELNAVIGIIRSLLPQEHDWQKLLHHLQRELMVVMSHVATPSVKRGENPNTLRTASIYQQALSFADELCLTEINSTAPEADAYFPEVSQELWQEKSREAHPADEKHLCSYAFVDYVRK